MDTLALSKHLQQAGIESTKADALAKGISQSVDTTAATKADLARTESRLIIWFVGALLAQRDLVN